MFYKPHILQKKVISKERDNYGRPTTTMEQWVNVCPCRCDDNTVTEFRSDNGKVYRPKYHVVCEGRADISAGDELRVVFSDGKIRGQGKCERPKHLNMLNYSELWM